MNHVPKTGNLSEAYQFSLYKYFQLHLRFRNLGCLLCYRYYYQVRPPFVGSDYAEAKL